MKKEKKRSVANGCPHYKKCGGCQLLNMTYEEQLSFKQVKVIRELGRFCHVDEIIGMEKPFHYRNKVQSAFGFRNGKIISGVYQSSTHNIIPVEECKLEDKRADEIILSIKELLPRFKLTSYNEDTGRGFLRHVLIKRGFSTGEIMVVLISGTNIFPQKLQFVNELLRRNEDITTVIWNINDKRTSLVLGERQQLLFGKGYIEDVLCGKRFRISPKSFYQVNPLQTEKLYSIAMDFASLTGKERVFDAYCGIGTIGLVASDRAKEVIGVELNADAVRDARINSAINNCETAKFFCDDAGKFMTEMAKENQKVDVLFMDPPRAGSDLPFLKSAVALSPKRIVYISCNVETQGRDIAFLVRNGYKVKRVQPVDMFPHTNHVECVVLMSKVKE